MNKHKLLLVLVLSIFIDGFANAQSAKVDSLENLLKTYKTDDTIKVNLLNEIAYVVFEHESKKTINYATQSGELSDKLKFLKGKAESLWLIGMYYHKTDESLALDYYQKSMKLAETAKYKTGIAKCWNAYGVIYNAQNKIAQSIDCYNKAIIISEEIHNKSETVKYLQNLSITHFKQGNYTKAIETDKKAIKLSEELNDKYLCSVILNNLGAVYERMGNKPEALECYQKSITFREKLTDKIIIIGTFYTISKLYSSQSDYQNALIYLQKALKLAEEIKDKHEISSCYERIGNLFISMNNPQALEYLQKALKIQEELSETSSILTTSNRIGDFYLKQKNATKALEYYQKSMKIAEEIGKKGTTCSIFYKIGKIYLLQKKYGDAMSYTLKSLEIANDLKMLSNLKDIHFQLSEIYAATSDYKNAYQHHKIYKELNDSIFSEKNIKKIAELEFTFKYEKEKQAAELDLQKKDAIYTAEKQKQKTLIFSLIGGFVLMFLLAVFVYRSYRIKRKTNIVLIEQKHEIEELNAEYLAVNEELKQSNEQLYFTKSLVEKSEEKLKLLIKNSNDIFVLVNDKGEQFFISDVAKKLTGYDVEELLGAVEDVIYPEDIEIVQKHWDRVLANKNTTDIIQYRHRHKEKGYVWFEAAAQNFLDHPAIKAIVANIRDINERKKIEQELKESEKKLSKIIEQISDALVIIDIEGKIIIWNSGAEKITGLSANETINKKLADIQYQLAPLHLKNKGAIEKIINGIVTFETPDLFNRFIDDEILLSDNSVRNIQCINFPIDLGTHYLFGSVYRDITEKIYIEKQLEEFNDTKQKLLTIELDKINHELETNQKSITAATLKLIQNAERDSQTIDRLMEIEKNTNPTGKQKINTLVSDYKRLSYNSNWDEFEILFEKVHSSFYEKLNAQFPTLTANERKICAFLKLNMSSKDMAQITFQSEDALKKARLRLRQKLEIGRETNLVAFLQNI